MNQSKIKQALLIIILLSGLLLPGNLVSHLWAQGGAGPHFPRLANAYLYGEIRDIDVDLLSGWDLFVFTWYIDNSAGDRESLSRIKALSPNTIFLMYHLSFGVNATVNPPDPLYTMAEQYNWWLYDYEGNRLVDPGWTFNKLLNFTNTEAAKGSNPAGLKPNVFLPEDLMTNHIGKYDYWDGVFYDNFSDNIRYLYQDVKDATLNQIAEFDFQPNNNEPLFDNLWRNGMLSLVENTLSHDQEVIMMGNGLHRTATPFLNGIFFENYNPDSHNLSDLASVQKYIADTERDRPISVINGMATGEDPMDYTSMRFTLLSTLLTDAFFSFDFGSQNHGETLWYDEFSVKPSGEVAAITTHLKEDIDSSQDKISVTSTEGFPGSGVILIDGEQIYYAAKTDSEFVQCMRGYPRITYKYDLSAPHVKDSKVIHYLNDYRGYLGSSVSDAYDMNDPSIKLKDLFASAGWWATGETADDINSRIWRRDFEHGAVFLNPSRETKTVNGLGDGLYMKIKGLQDPSHNDGQLVRNTLVLNSEDGYVLLTGFDQISPDPPGGLTIIE
jgi:hypothetical protein